jgi:antitoxin component of MazEF toxin-antitoxin module
MEYETFYGKIRKDGDSLVITIPSNYVAYGGYNEGDKVKVMMKKVLKEE